jgi:hypothetical protein
MKLICGPPVETPQATRVFVSLLKEFLLRLFDYMAEIHFIHGLCLIGAQQTAYGLNDSGSFPGRDREFIFATYLSSLNLGPNQAPIKWVQALFHRPEHRDNKYVGLNATTVNLHGINGQVLSNAVCQM